jgi:hypothetical protein
MTNNNEHAALVRSMVADLEKQVDRQLALGRLGHRAEAAREAMYDELAEQPLSVELELIVNVTLGTGGPACGVEFTVEKHDRYGLEVTSARAWWQDWFTGKTYHPIDSETADILADMWGVTTMEVQ